MPSMMNLIVRGRVQGVFFRDSTVQYASKLSSVVGWVRNRQGDRTVEVFAKGQQNELDQLKDFCHKGPERARVDSVEVVSDIPEEYVASLAKVSGFVRFPTLKAAQQEAGSLL